MMRIILAKIFRVLFKVPFFRKRYFGFHKRIFIPFKLFKGVTQQVKVKGGIYLSLQIDDWIQESIYFLGTYEKAELQLIKEIVKQGDVFIDLGANIGMHTLNASKLVGKNGRVICFEPFSKNFESLKKNMAINNSTNITSENLAVGETDSFIDLFYDDKEMNLGMVSSSRLTEYSHNEKVKVVSLDSYLRDSSIKKVDFIKIDIEGNEYAALLGMKETLTKFHPQLLIEILEEDESNSSKNESKIMEYLESLGYEKYFIDDSGSLSTTDKNPERRNYLFIKKH